MSERELEVYCIGESKEANPGGLGIYGWILRDENGRQIDGEGEVIKRDPVMTPTLATLEGCAIAIEKIAGNYPGANVKVRIADRIASKQLTGEWRTRKLHARNMLERIYETIASSLGRVSFDYVRPSECPEMKEVVHLIDLTYSYYRQSVVQGIIKVKNAKPELCSTRGVDEGKIANSLSCVMEFISRTHTPVEAFALVKALNALFNDEYQYRFGSPRDHHRVQLIAGKYARKWGKETLGRMLRNQRRGDEENPAPDKGTNTGRTDDFNPAYR